MSWGERSCRYLSKLTPGQHCPIAIDRCAENCNVECREYKWDRKTVPDSGPPKMSVKDFREAGYLQELNRQFLHPLGVAMEVVVDDDKTESFGLVWDSRDDPEGYYFGLAESDTDRVDRFRANAEKIKTEQDARQATRQKALGFIIEPIPEG